MSGKISHTYTHTSSTISNLQNGLNHTCSSTSFQFMSKIVEGSHHGVLQSQNLYPLQKCLPHISLIYGVIQSSFYFVMLISILHSFLAHFCCGNRFSKTRWPQAERNFSLPEGSGNVKNRSKIFACVLDCRGNVFFVFISSTYRQHCKILREVNSVNLTVYTSDFYNIF